MANSLQSLFQAIAQARNEEELRSQIMDSVGKYFAANRWRIFFFDRLPSANSRFQNLLEVALHSILQVAISSLPANFKLLNW